MKRTLFTLFSTLMFLGGVYPAFAQEVIVSPESFAPPEEVIVRMPFPENYAPVIRRCPAGTVFIPDELIPGAADWATEPHGICEAIRPGWFYVYPSYGPGPDGVILYRRGHWAPVRLRNLYINPTGPYYRRPFVSGFYRGGWRGGWHWGGYHGGYGGGWHGGGYHGGYGGGWHGGGYHGGHR